MTKRDLQSCTGSTSFFCYFKKQEVVVCYSNKNELSFFLMKCLLSESNLDQSGQKFKFRRFLFGIRRWTSDPRASGKEFRGVRWCGTVDRDGSSGFSGFRKRCSIRCDRSSCRRKLPPSSPDRCDRNARVSFWRHDRIGSAPPKSGQREALLSDTNESRATGEPGNKWRPLAITSNHFGESGIIGRFDLECQVIVRQLFHQLE